MVPDLLKPVSLLGFAAIGSFALALLLGASAVVSPVAAVHVAFAIGAIPLIFGAMLHFVPVLTRSASPHRAIATLPFVVQAAGVPVVLALQGILPRWALHPVAVIDLVAALILIVWMLGRARHTLGTPHPGWRWYAASLTVLVVALAAVPPLTAGLAPHALRNLHLHLNTLGFIGLAALGTLPVLLPTALGQSDTQAAHWLRRRLPVALAGVLILALAAALGSPAALIGAAFLAVIAFGLLVHWGRTFGWMSLMSDGAVASLASALGFFGLLQLIAPIHGLAGGSAQGLVQAFATGFLLPLVSGALTQLLPVWRWPGPQTPARHEMRRRLARFGRLRAVLLLPAGVLAMLGATAPAILLAGISIALFVIDLASALRVKPAAR